MMMNMDGKLDELERSLEEIERRMSEPSAASNPGELQRLGKKRSEIIDIVEVYREYKDTRTRLEEARNSPFRDPELSELAREETRNSSRKWRNWSRGFKSSYCLRTPTMTKASSWR